MTPKQVEALLPQTTKMLMDKRITHKKALRRCAKYLESPTAPLLARYVRMIAKRKERG